MRLDDKYPINEEAIYDKSCKNPIFIILSSGSSLFAKGIKAVTKSEFSHAMISFNSKLDPLYSFGTKAGGKGLGFVINNPKDYVFDIEDAKYSVYVMFVTDKAKKAMLKSLQWFTDKKDRFKYDFHGIADIWMGKESDQRQDKWFCSRFVMYLVSQATKLSKVPSLWKPGDIESLDNISLVNRGFNFYNYNYKVTDKHVNDIKKGRYNKGDVLYEKYDNFPSMSGVSKPKTGFPSGCSSEQTAVEMAAFKIAKDTLSKYSNSGRRAPYSYFNEWNTEYTTPNKMLEYINKKVPFQARLKARLYQHDFTSGKLKISVLILSDNKQIYGTWIISETYLLRFNHRSKSNKTVYEGSTLSECKSTADLAKRQLEMARSSYKYMNIIPTEVEPEEDSYIFAEFTIESDKDIEDIKKFSNQINKILETSTSYKGILNIDTDHLVIGSEGVLSIIPEESIDEIKSYKNPAMQLQIKNSKKRNSKIKTGNYSGNTSSTKKKLVKEETDIDMESVAKDAHSILRKEIIECRDCAYVYSSVMRPYKEDSYAIMEYDRNKLKPQDVRSFDSCLDAIFNQTKKRFNRPGYSLNKDDHCIYISKNK